MSGVQKFSQLCLSLWSSLVTGDYGEQIILAAWAHCLSEQTWGSVNHCFSYLLLHASWPQT